MVSKAQAEVLYEDYMKHMDDFPDDWYVSARWVFKVMTGLTKLLRMNESCFQKTLESVEDRSVAVKFGGANEDSVSKSD